MALAIPDQRFDEIDTPFEDEIGRRFQPWVRGELHPFLNAYPTGMDFDPDAIEFALWPGYGCRDAHEAHSWLLELLTAASDVLRALDETEELWSFYPRNRGGNYHVHNLSSLLIPCARLNAAGRSRHEAGSASWRRN